MGLLANTLIACLFSLLPGPPGVKINNAYFQLFPVDKLNGRCPGIRLDKDINFFLYHGLSPYQPKTLKIGDDDVLDSTGIDLNLTTVVYFPPFFEGHDGRSVATLRNAYMTRGNHNFVVVDSKRLNAGPWYPAAVTNTYFVGRYAGLLMDYLILSGLTHDRLHLIGTSIGAHAAGVAANFMKTGKPGRITGLDPAAMLFRAKPAELRLDKTDATMVDIIHTDDFFGMASPMGHVDFYVNSGRSPQPGCEFSKVLEATKRYMYAVFCSHLRSYQLYAETVLRPNAFPGTACFSLSGLKLGRCFFGTTMFMGMEIPSKARGVYYVPTGNYPYTPFGEIT